MSEHADPIAAAFRALCDREGGWRKVAAAIGATPHTLYQVYAGIKLPSGRPRSVGPSLREKLDAHFPGWNSVDSRVAQTVSHTPFDHPLLTRERLMTMGELPARFTFVLEDDAMGAFGRAGTEVLFQAGDQAAIGAGILVRDKLGNLHVRRKAQGRSQAHWIGQAPNTVFRHLDSEADGLQVLAVWRGVVNQGLEDR